MDEQALREAMSKNLKVIGKLINIDTSTENYPEALLCDIEVEHDDVLIVMRITVPEELKDFCDEALNNGTNMLVVFQDGKITELAFE